MMTRLGVLILAIGFAACSANTKPELVALDMAAYQTDQTIADVEPLVAQTGALTPDQSRGLCQLLRASSILGLEATHVLQAWDPTQPIPAQLPGLVRELMKLAATIVLMLPRDPAVEAALDSAKRREFRATPEEQLVELDKLWRALLVQIDARLAVLGKG